MTKIEALARAEQLTERWRNGNKASVFFEVNQGTGMIICILIMNNLDAHERMGFVEYMMEQKCSRF